MRNWLPLLALLVALLAVPARAATAFGEIEISMAPEPRGNNNHGYSEYLFYVQNKGDRPRTVALVMPHQGAPAPGPAGGPAGGPPFPGGPPGAGGPGMMGGPGGMPGEQLGLSSALLRAGVPVSAWSDNWLGYSRYDGVIVTPKDIHE